MIVLLLLALLLSPPAHAAPDTAALAYDPHLGAQLPPGAELRDEAGRPVALGALLGDVPLVLAIGYFACPNLCGVVREDALLALDRAGLRPGTDYRLLVLSIDPAETPVDAARAREAALSRYPEPPPSTWRFLTAPEPGLAAIAQAAGFRYRFDAASKLFLHPAGLVIASPSGVVSSYLLGVGYESADLRSAVLRANQGAVAEAVSPILLLCFHFDPKTGSYDFAVYRALSVLAALTVATLVALFVLLRRRERGSA